MINKQSKNIALYKYYALANISHQTKTFICIDAEIALFCCSCHMCILYGYVHERLVTQRQLAH